MSSHSTSPWRELCALQSSLECPLSARPAGRQSPGRGRTQGQSALFCANAVSRLFCPSLDALLPDSALMRISSRQPVSGWGLRRSLVSVSCADSSPLFCSQDEQCKHGLCIRCSSRSPSAASLAPVEGTPLPGLSWERVPRQQGRPRSRSVEPGPTAVRRGPCEGAWSDGACGSRRVLCRSLHPAPHWTVSAHKLACHRSHRDGSALYAVSIKLALNLYTILVPHISTGRLHFLSGLYVLE